METDGRYVLVRGRRERVEQSTEKKENSHVRSVRSKEGENSEPFQERV